MNPEWHTKPITDSKNVKPIFPPKPISEVPINLNEVDQVVGHLRLYHTKYYVAANKPTVTGEKDFWDQSCFGGVIICKQFDTENTNFQQLLNTSLSIWRIKKKDSDSQSFEIATRINVDKTKNDNKVINSKPRIFYYKQFGTYWPFIFINNNNDIDRSCGLHYHAKARGFFKAIYPKSVACSDSVHTKNNTNIDELNRDGN